MEDVSKNQTMLDQRDDLITDAARPAREVTLPRLVLASASPRRAEILRTTGWLFEAMPVDIDESRLVDEDALTYVRRLAPAKAEMAARAFPNMTTLGADTVVVIEDQILGKPRDEDDACRMLRLLNNRWHRVLTGIALVNPRRSREMVNHEMTEVKFAEMNEEEIRWYVSTGEPMDKAGAYAIQGLGARFIEGIRGDYFNVVGLPLRLLYQMVNEITSEKIKD